VPEFCAVSYLSVAIALKDTETARHQLFLLRCILRRGAACRPVQGFSMMTRPHYQMISQAALGQLLRRNRRMLPWTAQGQEHVCGPASRRGRSPSES
jgi:hypothetical protein